MGHGALEDHVRGIVQKPVLVHAAEVVYGCCVETVYGFIVGMAFAAAFRLLLFQNLVVLDLVVHIIFGL